MNEHQLIEWIQSECQSLPPSVKLGIGDDAAVIANDAPNKLRVFKADMLIENVHFSAKHSRPQDWGKKAMKCNISDCAAMGAEPEYALVSIGIPQRATLAQAKSVYRGILSECRAYGITLIGGDTTRSEQWVLSVMMTGRLMGTRPMVRSGAKAGDYIFVTGALGGSYPSGKHAAFTPRIKEAEFLIKHYNVHAMMDLSDGLAEDLRQLGRASGVGAFIQDASLPLAPKAEGIISAYTDGEDFELLFTLSPKEASALLQDKRWAKTGMNFFPIGRIVNKNKGFKRQSIEGKAKTIPQPKDHHF